jgi:hypothetical protein
MSKVQIHNTRRIIYEETNLLIPGGYVIPDIRRMQRRISR